jgi:GDP-L-fucose synthase
MEHCNTKDISTPAGDFINIGSGIEHSIKDLAAIVQKVVYADAPGRNCRIIWEKDKPNGTPRKLLDCSRLYALGWKAATTLEEGIARAYSAFRQIREYAE